MNTLITVGLVVLSIVLLIGIIRVITKPYTGFIDFLMELMLLDWLGNVLIWVIELFFLIND
jgi:hypothetical protein